MLQRLLQERPSIELALAFPSLKHTSIRVIDQMQHGIASEECTFENSVSVKLMDTEWDQINEVIAALQPFAEVTTEIQARAAYLSDAAFFANLLSQFLDRDGPRSSLTPLMTSVMKSKTDRLPVPFSQLVDPESPYMMCLALDPRYSHMAASETWSRVQDHVNTHSLTQPPLLRLPVEPKGYIDLVYQQLTCPQTAFITQESEIDRFRRLEPLPRTTDPLAYWQTARAKFPVLADLARHYFIMQRTEVPCERLFTHRPHLLFREVKLEA
jgi:hypothetical protein